MLMDRGHVAEASRAVRLVEDGMSTGYGIRRMRVFICSPWRVPLVSEAENVAEASEKWRKEKEREHWIVAVKMCELAIRQGYAPFAPHLMYPQVLGSDESDGVREKGIACGMAFLAACDELWVFVDGEISEGMRSEIAAATRMWKTIRSVTGSDIGWPYGGQELKPQMSMRREKPKEVTAFDFEPANCPKDCGACTARCVARGKYTRGLRRNGIS